MACFAIPISCKTHDFALVANQDLLPIPQFAVCHTPLQANFCTCGRYALFEVESEALWS